MNMRRMHGWHPRGGACGHGVGPPLWWRGLKFPLVKCRTEKIILQTQNASTSYVVPPARLTGYLCEPAMDEVAWAGAVVTACDEERGAEAEADDDDDAMRKALEDDDMLRHILDGLPLRELVGCACVDRRWQAAALHDASWLPRRREQRGGCGRCRGRRSLLSSRLE